MDHLRSTCFAVDGTFDHGHYYPSLETHLCCKQNTLLLCGLSRLFVYLTPPTHFMPAQYAFLCIFYNCKCICTSRYMFYTQCYLTSLEYKCFLLHLSRAQQGNRMGFHKFYEHSLEHGGPYLHVSLSPSLSTFCHELVIKKSEK